MDLHPGEEMVFDGHPSWRGVMSFYITGAVIVAVLVVAVIVLSSAPGSRSASASSPC